MKRILFAALAAGFLFLGFSAYMQSRGVPKNKRIYRAVHVYSPYYLEKRFGGLQIRTKTDKTFKEKPSNMAVFHRLDQLEKTWAAQHLKRNGSTLTVHDKTGKTLGKIQLKTPDETAFVHQFYGL